MKKSLKIIYTIIVWMMFVIFGTASVMTGIEISKRMIDWIFG